MEALFALLPIALALVLLVGLRLPASKAMPVCALAMASLSLFIWKVSFAWVAAAVAEALVITVSILYIVFGALLLLAVMRRGGAIASLQASLSRLTPDGRLQAVLVAWLLGSFLEGAGGFGTPAAITAPILIGLGFRAVPAVAAALVGDSAAVTFGAIGTPILIGIRQALEGTKFWEPGLELAVGQRIAVLDFGVGALVPALLVFVVVAGSGSEGGGLRRAVSAVPFALCVGLSHMAAAAAVAWLLGPELPSLIGPAVGFGVALFLLKTGVFVPRDIWRVGPEARAAEAVKDLPHVGRALLPYALLAGLLVVTRLRALGLGPKLAEVEVAFAHLFGTTVVARLQPLYSPGLFLVLTAVAALFLLGAGARRGAKDALAEAGRAAAKAALALFAAVALVRIFIHSGVNGSGLLAMPEVLAVSAARALGDVWPAVAPWLGALGSFIAGSTTFSNMLFGGLQAQVAHASGFDPVHVLALQGMGAAAGNMICVHNIVAACAVTGVLGQEGAILRRTAPPVAVYLLLATAVGLLFA